MAGDKHGVLTNIIPCQYYQMLGFRPTLEGKRQWVDTVSMKALDVLSPIGDDGSNIYLLSLSSLSSLQLFEK